MGPTFTFSRPWIVSPSKDSTVAPGTQGAVRSTSSSRSQACATGTGTENWCSSCIALPPTCGGPGPSGECPRQVLTVVGHAGHPGGSRSTDPGRAVLGTAPPRVPWVTRHHIARRLDGLGTTVFAEMSALALATGSVNLGQGFPDTDGPPEVAEAAVQAIRGGANQYPPGPGIPDLRLAVAEHQRRFYGIELDPGTEVVVTTGATEAVAASLFGL